MTRPQLCRRSSTHAEREYYVSPKTAFVGLSGSAIVLVASTITAFGVCAAPLEGVSGPDMPAPAANAWHTTKPPPLLEVATLNLAHGRGQAIDQFRLSVQQAQGNIDAAAVVVKREAPAVLAVQEADAPSAWSGLFDHVARLAGAANFPHVHHGLHTDAGLLGVHIRTGTALLAKRPLVSAASRQFTANRTHVKGFVTAEIQFDGRRVLVASIHLASGSKDIRRQQAEQLITALRSGGAAMVLMGDFNSSWSDEQDAVRVVASRLKLETYEPHSRGLDTFRANRPRSRIDWILISPQLEFVDYRVWPDQVSDHLGVAARLRWRRRTPQ